MQIRRCLAGLALLALPAFTQGGSVEMVGGEIHGNMRFPVPRYRGSPILGAPYNAQRISESVMTGSDGTRFTTSQQQETIYRDSQGRTRTERFMAPGGSNVDSSLLVEISDPVAGVDYVLDTQHKIAHRTQRAGMPPRPGGGGAGGGGTISANTVAAGSGPVSPPSTGGTFRVGGAVGASATPAPAAATSGAAPARPEIRSEELGNQMIEGVMARGTRRVETWPTGSQGNDRPFESVRETWDSPDLREMVLFKSSDPRRGENTIKLVHIDTSEPPISLFQAPADYTVVDESAPFEIQWTGKRKP
jgi:hypothetical protein